MPIHVVATYSSTHELAADSCTPQLHTFAADMVGLYDDRRLLHVINVAVIGDNEVGAARQLPPSIQVDGCICRPDSGLDAGCRRSWG